jgi:hypothetical protein
MGISLQTESEESSEETPQIGGSEDGGRGGGEKDSG